MLWTVERTGLGLIAGNKWFCTGEQDQACSSCSGECLPSCVRPWHSPELIVSRLAWGKALCQVVENKSDLPVLALLYKHSFWDCSEKAGTPVAQSRLGGLGAGLGWTPAAALSHSVWLTKTPSCLQFSTVPQGSLITWQLVNWAIISEQGNL